MLLVFCFKSFSLFAQQSISMQEAINFALENNLDIKKAGISVRIADNELSRSKYDRYPDFHVSMAGQLNIGRSLDFTSYSYVNDMTLLSSQNIESNIIISQGGQKTSQIRYNKYILDNNKSAVKRIKNDVTLNVVSLYLKLLSLKNQLIAANQQDTLLLKQLDYEQKNVQAGKKSNIELFRTKVSVAKNQLNITSIQNEINYANANFIQLLNLNSNTQLTLEEPTDMEINKDRESIEEIFVKAKDHMPQIKQAELNKLALEQQVSIAKSAYYPRLSLSANAASNYSQKLKKTFLDLDEPFFTQFKTNLYQFVSLNLTFPIFNRFSTKISVAQARLRAEESSITVIQQHNELYKVINQALGDLEASFRTYKYSQDAYLSAKETYAAVLEKYKLGTAPSIDLDLAQSELNRTRLESIQSKYEMVFRDKIIDFYLGKPIFY